MADLGVAFEARELVRWRRLGPFSATIAGYRHRPWRAPPPPPSRGTGFGWRSHAGTYGQALGVAVEAREANQVAEVLAGLGAGDWPGRGEAF